MLEEVMVEFTRIVGGGSAQHATRAALNEGGVTPVRTDFFGNQVLLQSAGLS